MILHARLRLVLLLLFANTPLHVLATPTAALAAPRASGLTQMEFSAGEMSRWNDLPTGAYRVPNSDVVISGHQNGGAAPYVLFGTVGMAIQGSVDAYNAKDAVASAEQALTFSIDDEARAKLQAAMAEPEYAAVFASQANSYRRYEITGSVAICFINQRDAMPYVVLRVRLLDKRDATLWSTRYIASTGTRKPLAGDGSWTVGNTLRPHVSKLLDLAIGTMLKDIAHPYPRDEASLVTARGYFLHDSKPLQLVGYKLAEEDGRMLFLPKLGTSFVFAGVNILDSASIAVSPTVKGDAPLKVLDRNDPSLAAPANKGAGGN
jgi:hypothetical protein